MTTSLTLDTRAVRAGLESCEVTGAVVPPIHLSSTFAFKGFGDKRKYDYSRSGNPTRDLLGEALNDSFGTPTPEAPEITEQIIRAARNDELPPRTPVQRAEDAPRQHELADFDDIARHDDEAVRVRRSQQRNRFPR